MTPPTLRSALLALIALAPLTPLHAQTQTAGPTAEQLKSWIATRQQRVDLLRDEIRQTDARIESRLDAIIDTLTSIGDSKDSRTKVARMKEDTGKRLMKTIGYYDQKRATLRQELRNPQTLLRAEEKQRIITAFDARIEKRTQQILALNKSMPAHQDYERYKTTGGGWYGTNTERNEDFEQNRRMTAHTNTQRDALVKQLDSSIARLDRLGRDLRSQLAATTDPTQHKERSAEVAKNDALIAERRRQRLEVLKPSPDKAQHGVALKEAMDLDKALQTAINDLSRDFTTLFARYNSFVAELTSLHATEATLAAKDRTLNDWRGGPFMTPPIQAPATESRSPDESQWMKEATELKAALDEHAIVAITDSQGRVTFVNERFCAISKYPREELLGQDQRIIDSGHHPMEFFREIWHAIAHGKVWRGEIKNRAKDGKSYWVATTIVPFLDQDGKLRQFVAIGADITEQKRVEDELAEKLRLQQLLAELSTRFVGLQSEHVGEAIVETQRLIVETLGMDRSTLWQLAEHGPGMVYTHSWQRPGWPPLPPNFSTDKTLPWSQATVLRGEVLCFSRLDDLLPEALCDVETFRSHDVKANVTFPLIANGRVFGALAFATLGAEREWREGEIAELKLIAQTVGNVVGRQRAEMREEELRNELAHTMRVASLGELAATLTHELNQPLAAILSNAQAARRFIGDGVIELDELRAILDDIVRDDKRAGAVIHSLREMVSKRPAIREQCFLNELVLEVLELMRSEMLEAKIEVRSTLAQELPFVEVARVELQQVLVNLLVNARHAMEATPPDLRIIDVETRAGAGVVEIAVRDRGHGIPPERLPAVFNPFVSTRTSGLGIGLSICRRIIENHGGRIEARNRETSGAVFSISLPAATV